MELTYQGLKDTAAWEPSGIRLPSYDAERAAGRAKAHPCWVHFGIGNIFRIFIGGIADELLEAGLLDRGLTCVETFDYEVVDRIYQPFDNLSLNVVLDGDGSRDMKVSGALSEAVKAQSDDPDAWDRLREIFKEPELQLVSFTITEKGYALRDPDGNYLPYVQKDIEKGPAHASGAMGIITAMLFERFRAGKLPVTLISMDNCSQNGELLEKAVKTMAEEWEMRGFVTDKFRAYLNNGTKVSFPWTMIDKITPRPSEEIAADLAALGLKDMDPVTTEKRTYIAPFVNAERPQYLVIEDWFTNGRPPLEKGSGVYITDRRTVNLAERMKVTACLNPVHSALGPIGVVLGINLFADMLDDPELLKMGRTVAYGEGMPVIENPGIISPETFTDELFRDRFPNHYLGDTNLRLCTDVTQGWSVRFGVTIRSYFERFGRAERLTAIPLGIAGCLRYMMGVDDNGKEYELAPDPLAEELHECLKDVVIGRPETLTDQLKPVLGNPNLFLMDLYEAGIGTKIEEMLRKMVSGHGACRNTVYEYMKKLPG